MVPRKYNLVASVASVFFFFRVPLGNAVLKKLAQAPQKTKGHHTPKKAYIKITKNIPMGWVAFLYEFLQIHE